MLHFNETITYFRTGEAGALTRIPLAGASWRESQIIEMQGGALGGERVVTARFTEACAPEGFAPQAGDYIARGDVQADTAQALLNVPHARIIAVRDNRRGQLAHWAVSGV